MSANGATAVHPEADRWGGWTPPSTTTSVATCQVCQHAATRSTDPWDNQYQCAEGCRCTMQGCCPGQTVREAR